MRRGHGAPSPAVAKRIVCALTRTGVALQQMLAWVFCGVALPRIGAQQFCNLRL